MTTKQCGLIIVLTVIIIYLLFELFVCFYGFITNTQIDEMPPPVGSCLAVIILFLISPIYCIIYDIFNKKDK